MVSAPLAPGLHLSFTCHAPLLRPSFAPRSPHSLIGNPDLGFGGLRQFGPGLINHVNLKVRDDLQMDDIMLVDSPGMIDSPHMDAHTKDRGKAF